ncbi:flavodoxin family protein [Cytophagaceae bacterium ABcell3]|nr:flavodoxin family protein [Cytophagaceae bacterium ABcell3]
MRIKTLFLNCTLKKTPETSNTEALIKKAEAIFNSLGAQTEILRLADYHISLGIVPEKVDEKDEFPLIYNKIKEADILIVGSPIWFGNRSSLVQQLMERLDGSYTQANKDNGQYPLYNKVAGTIITGNEDGAHMVASQTLFNMMHLGCTIPPNSDCYWVGEAGPGESYIKEGGAKHLYTNKTCHFLVHNTFWYAQLLKQHPNPNNLNTLYEAAQKES